MHDELPNVHYGPPSKQLDWRKEKLHNSDDDDENHPVSKSTRLLLRGDPRKLFPPQEEEDHMSLIKSAELGRQERSKVFNQK
jgi:hypothetical protein